MVLGVGIWGVSFMLAKLVFGGFVFMLDLILLKVFEIHKTVHFVRYEYF